MLSHIDIELKPLNRWLKSIGRTSVTGWRWRRRGWLRTVNIGGQHYLTPQEIRRFHRRAKSGEFASAAKLPMRKEAVA